MPPQILKCCVVGCTSTNERFRLYSIPRNDQLRELWLSFLLPHSPFLSTLSKKSLIMKRVCERHFEKRQLRADGKRIQYPPSYPSLFTELEITHGIPLQKKSDKVSFGDHTYSVIDKSMHGSAVKEATTEEPITKENLNPNKESFGDHTCGIIHKPLDVSTVKESEESIVKENLMQSKVAPTELTRQMMAIPLPPLESLDVEGDNASVGHRWEKWKRALLIYLDASDINSPQRKTETLLHFGGTNLQEIYYNLPGAHVEAAENVDVFKVAIEKLDEFFLPKQNLVYERHMFRLIKQEQGEKFERFLLRLRKQADRCNFDRKDDHLIDQITEKCTSPDLRKKILTIGDSITLDRIVTEANMLEVVNDQMENYGNKKQESQEVNAINNKKKKEETNLNKQTYNRNNKKGCGRCGSGKHYTEDEDCPARAKHTTAVTR